MKMILFQISLCLYQWHSAFFHGPFSMRNSSGGETHFYEKKQLNNRFRTKNRSKVTKTTLIFDNILFVF